MYCSITPIDTSKISAALDSLMAPCETADAAVRQCEYLDTPFLKKLHQVGNGLMTQSPVVAQGICGAVGCIAGDPTRPRPPGMTVHPRIGVCGLGMAEPLQETLQQYNTYRLYRVR